MEKIKWNSIDKKQNGLEQSKNDKYSHLLTIPLLDFLPLPVLKAYGVKYTEKVKT